MNEIVKNQGGTLIFELIKSANIAIKLEQWPGTVAILGICTSCVVIAWINRPLRSANAL